MAKYWLAWCISFTTFGCSVATDTTTESGQAAVTWQDCGAVGQARLALDRSPSQYTTADFVIFSGCAREARGQSHFGDYVGGNRSGLYPSVQVSPAGSPSTAYIFDGFTDLAEGMTSSGCWDNYDECAGDFSTFQYIAPGEWTATLWLNGQPIPNASVDFSVVAAPTTLSLSESGVCQWLDGFYTDGPLHCLPTADHDQAVIPENGGYPIWTPFDEQSISTTDNFVYTLPANDKSYWVLARFDGHIGTVAYAEAHACAIPANTTPDYECQAEVPKPIAFQKGYSGGKAYFYAWYWVEAGSGVSNQDFQTTIRIYNETHTELDNVSYRAHIR
ncbi:MAG: hypothetical protein IPJ88_10075 [Myxococcales bacterium]|nr:MAG: hypothetical protein IPJ88_10075 [Myxococcales bacterium]